MLIWKFLGFSAGDSLGMKSFRRFQSGLSMPKCAVYHFREAAPGHWHACVDEAIMRKLIVFDDYLFKTDQEIGLGLNPRISEAQTVRDCG